MFHILRSLIGIPVLMAIAFIFSEQKKKISWPRVGIAVGVQLFLAVLLLKFPVSQKIFLILNTLVEYLETATRAGTSFVFGYLGGGELPFPTKTEANTYILAFQGLPLILVASALSSLFFYWKILPFVVRGFAKVLEKSLGVGGAEGFGIAGNIFLGMIEAPLFIKPYLMRLQRGEIFTLMASGMATIAGTVMVLYASILEPVLPNAMGHLLIASILSAPAAIAIARIMVPVDSEQLTYAKISSPSQATSSMEAITNGTLEGVKILLNIIAMLIVLVALVSLVNQILALFPQISSSPLSLERILGWIMAPLIWLLGVPWEDCFTAGSLMGTKTVLNELLAYLQLSKLPPGSISERSELIMTYTMCGFANFGSLGIMIGGLGSLVPERKSEIVSLGLKSIIAGTLATCMTGSIVGCLVWL